MTETAVLLWLGSAKERDTQISFNSNSETYFHPYIVSYRIYSTDDRRGGRA